LLSTVPTVAARGVTICRVECHAPRVGDIIIRPEGNPHNHYSVREFPGLAQVSYGSFQLAFDIAIRFARSVGTNVLYEEEGRFDLLESRAAANT
jgi:hypothetical protein